MKEKHRILVVDDEANVLQVLSEGLAAEGFEVRTADNGAKGVLAAVEFRPHLILLDLVMPGLDGWETLERLRRYDEISGTPVVLLTAKSDTENLFRSQQMRVLDYFIKPIEIGELAKFIRRYVGPI